MLRFTTLVLILCCCIATTVSAFLGFGDEEKLPGRWNGVFGSYVIFRKDGTMEAHEVLGFQHSWHWECSGGKLTYWYDDSGIIDQLRGIKIIKKGYYSIRFNGNDEMTLDDYHLTRDKTK